MRAQSVIRIVACALLAVCAVLPGWAVSGSEECTTLVAGGAATPTGGPLLWKNRDTGTLSNRVIQVIEHPYSFIALTDGDDSAGRMAWAGINTAGFAIANSASFPGQRLPNTNFSRSGGENEGSGYLRFDRENELLRTIPDGRLEAGTIFRVLARDLGHALLRHPARDEWKKLPADTPYWIHSNYTIDRPSTAASVLIQGVRPG